MWGLGVLLIVLVAEEGKLGEMNLCGRREFGIEAP